MPVGRTTRTRLLLLSAGALALTGPGCASLQEKWFGSAKSSSADAMALGNRYDNDPNAPRTTPELLNAQEQYRKGDYAAAGSAFHKIAENTKNSPQVAEEARFYEAECLYREDRYPKACDTYHKMLIDFPAGTYREQAVRRMFDVANFWLEDTRAEMADYREKREGKRWVVVPAVFHVENKKPFLDEEGRAMQALEQVHLNDITGPLADKALFLAGGVKFYREDYREADHYFTQLVEQHKDSPLAAQAVELAIISKHMSTGGPDYDGRKVAEARILVDTALRNYPQLATEKSGFLERQLYSINYQQAQKDFQTAEFYERTGHPGSAFFYYEIVRRRYPGSKFAETANDRMATIRSAAEAEQNDPKTGVFDSIQRGWDRLWGNTPKESPTLGPGVGATPPKEVAPPMPAPQVLPPPRVTPPRDMLPNAPMGPNL